MISNPTKGIESRVIDALSSLAKDTDPYHAVHWRRYARSLEITLENITANTKLLEIGTSSVIPLVLQQLAPDVDVEVTDFNGDDPMRALSLDINGNTRTVTAYCADLEFEHIAAEDASFDTVLCFEVIEHMEVDPMALLAEINRVLKPGGTLLLTTPNICGSRSIAKILQGYDPYFYMQYQRGATYNRHNYEYSVWSLRHLLEAAGFNGKVWTEDTWEDPDTHVIQKLARAGFRLTDTGDNIFAVMQKVDGIRARYPTPIYDA
jgi:ubiquinone/menaquinone biosynthesis C-methylase UbiE